MHQTISNTPRHPGKSDPDDAPDSLPVEPDEGPVPAEIPDDPEQQRVVMPEDRLQPMRSATRLKGRPFDLGPAVGSGRAERVRPRQCRAAAISQVREHKTRPGQCFWIHLFANPLRLETIDAKCAVQPAVSMSLSTSSTSEDLRRARAAASALTANPRALRSAAHDRYRVFPKAQQAGMVSSSTFLIGRICSRCAVPPQPSVAQAVA
jgi:hypothetical protein